MTKLKGKNALITGASRGIGQQIAKGLAGLGCNIIVHGRTKDSCSKTTGFLKKYDVNVYTVFGELSDENQIQGIIRQVEDLQIQVDILYNNAAIMTPYHDNIWTHSRKEWMDTYKVNVFAMYDLCSYFIPKMIKNGFGRVVNLSSGITHKPELTPYGSSKRAVDKMTNDIAFHLMDTPVRINSLDPGWLVTDMGGPDADNPVTAVLPGALAPVLIDDDGPNGRFYSAIAQEWKNDYWI